jgi:uncharacterized protein (UPF0147 family)
MRTLPAIAAAVPMKSKTISLPKSTTSEIDAAFLSSLTQDIDAPRTIRRYRRQVMRDLTLQAALSIFNAIVGERTPFSRLH